MRDWTEYDRWNDAIAAVVFSEEMSGSPVYLDLDEDVLESLAAEMQMEPQEAEDSLRLAVRSTVEFGGRQEELFLPHLQRLTRWRANLQKAGTTPVAPPILPLLAVTVLAAEAMGSGDVAANAYFPHLCKALFTTTHEQCKQVEQSYRRVAETVWDALDQWLTRIDGRRGLPTAFALSKRYIGLPMSQAMVRASDRRKLLRMFDSFGLPPGYAMSPADMLGLLDQWVKQQPCPVSTGFANLWSKPAARDRIAEVVVNELSNWDGSGRPLDTAASPAGPGEFRRGLRLLATVTRGLGRDRLQLTLALQAASDQPVTAFAVSADEQTIDLSFLPGPGGLLRLDHLQILDLESVVGGVLTVTIPGEATFSRHPRGLVPLSFDDVQAAFVESERVQLAQDTLLLVRNNGNRVDDVERILGQIARPGFHRLDAGEAGVPVGWSLFTGVEVMGRAGGVDADKYNELVPVSSTQLMLAGGLKLPGRIEKWSSLAPPEIRAVSQKASRIKVSISARNLEDPSKSIEIFEQISIDQVLTISTTDLELPDGDYRVSLFENDPAKPNSSPTKLVQQREMRLRSANTVDAWTWFGAKRLRHDFSTEGPWGVLSASETHGNSGLLWGVDGPFAQGAIEVATTISVETHVWWSSQRSGALEVRPALTVLAPNPNSCVVTGAHYLELPTPSKGGPKYIDGVCKYCGLVKRQPAWAKKPRREESSTKVQAITINVSGMTPPAEPNLMESWGAALDGLMHLGGGKRAWLERLGMHVGGSALSIHEFIKTVTALGFIDVSRDSVLQLDEWELVPRYLAELGDGSLALIGHWPGRVVEETVSHTEALGGSGIGISASEAVTVTALQGLNQQDAELVAATVEATIIWSSGQVMLDALPALSAVAGCLTRIPVPGGRTVQHFNLESASWNEVDSTAVVGALRIDSGHGWRYLFRNEDDVNQGVAAVTDAYLAKHLAAQLAGRPLMCFDVLSGSIVVPVGSDLPGLYERAAVLFSGRLPQITKIGTANSPSLLAYRDIPTEAAQRLWDVMIS